MTVWFFTQNQGCCRGLENVLGRPKPLSRSGVTCYLGPRASRGASTGPDTGTEDRWSCVRGTLGTQTVEDSSVVLPGIYILVSFPDWWQAQVTPARAQGVLVPAMTQRR